MSLIIAVPRERRTSERRVALDPSRVERLLQRGFQVQIEADCGHSASFHDEHYHGVRIMDSFAEVVADADIVVKVVCPTIEEIAMLPQESLLVCIMSAFQHQEEVIALRERRITVLAMDHLPRTTRAQPMDALSSQATVAGYKAALLAAELSPRLFPMLTTAAGTIRPSRVLVIGAGVAGLQAIATSKRLGAQVEAYDIRRAAKEQIESVGARMVDTGVEVEGAGGFARALRKDEKQKQHDVLAMHLANAHVVICAASIPGRRAPRIITEDMVDGMLPESVIVDMAASTGGNCELTRIGEHYYHNDTLIVGPLNLPSHGAVHASEMYARNVYNMLQLITGESGEIDLDPDDEIIAHCLLLHKGGVHHAGTARLIEVECVPFGAAKPSVREVPDSTAGWLSDEASPGDEPSVTGIVDEPSAPESGIHNAPGSLFTDTGSTPSAVCLENGHREVAIGGIDHSDTDLPNDMPVNLVPNSSSHVSLSTEERGAKDGVDGGREPADAEVDSDAVVARLPVDDALGTPADDLTRISGVGPALQERLYAFGYLRWQQLAELDDQGLEKLTVQLELTDEIEQQNWRGQALQLMENSH